MKKTIIKAPEDIKKSTSDDIRRYLHDALKATFVFEDTWIYSLDYEEKEGKTFFYFEAEYYSKGYYCITWGIEYKLDGVNVTFVGDMFEVKRETVYTPVKNDIPAVITDDDPFVEDGSLFKSLKKAISRIIGNSNKELPVIKQFYDEEMIAIETMYCPPNVEDGHGELMDSETIYKMVDSCNNAIKEGRLSGGLFHEENINDIEIIKAWVNECDCMIGDTEVPEGLPIVKVQFHDSDLWQMRKDGVLKGLSIGAKGGREEVNDE
jgi:hypothetical protein